MKLQLRNLLVSKAGLLLSVILLVLFVAATYELDWAIGRENMESSPLQSPDLEVKINPGSLYDYDVGSGVGGVAFQDTAAPSTSLSISSVGINYNAAMPDGKRMELQINGDSIVFFLPDWMLIPIANYANSEYQAVVSLFGPLTDSTRYNMLYHKAFKNTLLGVRLLQSDILFIRLNDFWNLPCYKGDSIFAFNERIPSGINHWYNPAVEISNVLTKGSFQSWILTDIGEDIRFDVSNKQLTFSGMYYYYFWDADWDAYHQTWDSLYQIYLAMGCATTPSAACNALITKMNDLEPRMFNITSVTNGLKGKMNEVEAYNPFVYDAVRQTMHYAALFRYLKVHHNSAWQSFLSQLQNVQIAPRVPTPNMWYLNGHVSIKKNLLFKDEIKELSIYPNPTDGSFNLALTSSIKGDLIIRVIDLKGRVIWNRQAFIANPLFEEEIDISNAVDGIYFVQIISKGKSATRRIIKK